MAICLRPYTLKIVIITSLFWMCIQIMLIWNNTCFKLGQSPSRTQDAEEPLDKMMMPQRIIKIEDSDTKNRKFEQQDDIKVHNANVAINIQSSAVNINIRDEQRKRREDLRKRSPYDIPPADYPVFLYDDPNGSRLFRVDNKTVIRVPPNLGEDGSPVKIPPPLAKLAKDQFSINEFNLVASNLISLHRNVPKQEPKECWSMTYPEELPTTSVIIVFHNEAWTTLLRTVHSVIDRSLPQFLKEIILVDDFSEKDFLGAPLETYMAQISTPPVHIFRMPKRSGLVQARLKGASEASGDTLTFLDSHCEAAPGWLEPLLAEVKANPKTIVCPIIDSIDLHTFAYKGVSDQFYGGFDWGMNFRWLQFTGPEMAQRASNHAEPIKTPTMAGGLFTMDRKYFYELGAYDDGMKTWGGENLEMSFRVWMCGGQLLIAPCSHVGHVFRSKSPYKWPEGASSTLTWNTMRTVNVWLDGYKHFYLKTHPNANTFNYGDVSSRIELRKNMCPHNFGWFLKNIFPKSPIPLVYHSLGYIRNDASRMCMDTLNRPSGQFMAVADCNPAHGMRQIFSFTGIGELRNNRECVTLTRTPASIRLVRCSSETRGQTFIYNPKSKRLYSRFTNSCLAVFRRQLHLRKCEDIREQEWDLEDYTPPSYNMPEDPEAAL